MANPLGYNGKRGRRGLMGETEAEQREIRERAEMVRQESLARKRDEDDSLAIDNCLRSGFGRIALYPVKVGT